MRKHLKKIVIALVILVIGLSVWSVMQNRKFHVIKTVPGITGKVSTSFTSFVVQTNRELDTNIDYMKQLDDPAQHVTSISVQGKTLILTTKEPEMDKKYTFTVKDVHAKNSEVIKAIKFNYTATYIPNNKLSKEEQALLEQQTHSTYNKDPIIAHLPHSTLDYKLEAEFGEAEGGSDPKFVLNATLFITEADQNTGQDEATATYKQEVIDYIKSLGLNPDSYTIHYQTSLQ